MNIDTNIQEMIDKAVLAEQEDRENSPRLSAGRLGWSLQWQMLYYLGVKPSTPDAYTLRKFQRGKDVEDRIVSWVNPEQKQVEVDYRGVKGFCDMVMDVPVEVKSVTNMAFKYIQKEGVKRGHRLQAELYAVGLGFDEFNVCYVASDDYRVLTFRQKVSGEVDKIIDLFEKQVEDGGVPVFKAEEPWHSIKKYSVYPIGS